MRWKFGVKNVFDLAPGCQVDCRACAPIFIFLTDPYSAHMSESSLGTELRPAAKEAPQRVRTLKKKRKEKKKSHSSASEDRQAFSNFGTWKQNLDSYWIMHEQRASSRDKPWINVSPRNPPAGARRRRRRRRWGLEQSRHLNSVCVSVLGCGGVRVKFSIQLKPN